MATKLEAYFFCGFPNVVSSLGPCDTSSSCHFQRSILRVDHCFWCHFKHLKTIAPYAFWIYIPINKETCMSFNSPCKKHKDVMGVDSTSPPPSLRVQIHYQPRVQIICNLFVFLSILNPNSPGRGEGVI